MMKAYVQKIYGKSELTRSKKYNKNTPEEESESFSEIFINFYQIDIKIN